MNARGIIQTHDPYRRGGPFDHLSDELKRDGEVHTDPGSLGPWVPEGHLHFPVLGENPPPTPPEEEEQ